MNQETFNVSFVEIFTLNFSNSQFFIFLNYSSSNSQFSLNFAYQSNSFDDSPNLGSEISDNSLSLQRFIEMTPRSKVDKFTSHFLHRPTLCTYIYIYRFIDRKSVGAPWLLRQKGKVTTKV